MTRVLIIDDDPTIREFIAYALADEGYQVGQAPDGRAALDLIELEHPDIILLDMRMPGLDGWQFARLYRRQCNRRKPAPIIVMTAARDAAQRAAEINAAGYLAKPFDLDVLLRQISSVGKMGL